MCMLVDEYGNVVSTQYALFLKFIFENKWIAIQVVSMKNVTDICLKI